MTRPVSILATIATLVGACYIPPAPPAPPPPPVRYYSATAEIDQSQARDGSGNDEYGPLTDDAGKVIHPGAKIAFYPPNECVTTPSEAGTGAIKEGGDLIRMYCGALMSRLEAQAAKADYEVVSWQALKLKDPLQAARELEVEVLFEVNELSLQRRELGTSRATDLRFGQQTDPIDRSDVAVGPSVARRCKAKFDPELRKSAARAMEAVLDVKAVEVQSGRALWYYKRALPEEGVQDEQLGVELYYAAPGKIDWVPPRPGKNRLQRFGSATAWLGGGLGIVPGSVLVAVGSVKDHHGLVSGGATLLSLGILALAGGVTMVALGNRQQRRAAAKPSYPPPVYPPADTVLCAYPTATPPWLAAPAGPQAQPVASATFSFEEQTSGGKDIGRARREKLIREAADEFVAKLGELASPRAAPAPAGAQAQRSPSRGRTP